MVGSASQRVWLYLMGTRSLARRVLGTNRSSDKCHSGGEDDVPYTLPITLWPDEVKNDTDRDDVSSAYTWDGGAIHEERS